MEAISGFFAAAAEGALALLALVSDAVGGLAKRATNGSAGGRAGARRKGGVRVEGSGLDCMTGSEPCRHFSLSLVILQS